MALCVLYLKRDGDSVVLGAYDSCGNSKHKAQEFLDGTNGNNKHIGEIREIKKPSKKELEKLGKTLIPKYEKDFFALEEQKAAEKVILEEKKNEVVKDEKNVSVATEEKSENTAEKYYKNEHGKYEIYYATKGDSKNGNSYENKFVETLENAKIQEAKGFIYIKRENDSPELIEAKKKELKPYKNAKECFIALGIEVAEPKKTEQKVIAKTIESKPEFTPRQNVQHSFGESKSDRSLDNLKNELVTMKQEIRKLNDKIYDCAKKTDITNALDSKLSSLSRNLKEYFESVIVKGLSTTPDKEFIAKKFDNMTEGVAETLDGFALDIQNTKSAAEAIQGKVTAVEGILSQKGVTISKETAPINDDAKAIANAKRLVDRLIADIAAAAVEYGNNKDVLDNLAEKEAQHNQEMIERTEQAKIDARQEVLIELLDKYENIDVLLESENDRTISAFLKNNGLTVDEELKKGTEIEITTEKCEQYLTKAKGVEDAGKYRVIRSAYHFGKKYFPAEIEKITE